MFKIGEAPYREGAGSEASLLLLRPGRGRKYRPHRLHAEDLEAAERLRCRVAKLAAARVAVESAYRKHCAVNVQGVWTPESVLTFVGALQTAGLKPSTIETYVSHLKEAEWRAHSRAAFVLLKDVKRLVQLDRAGGAEAHAPDFPSYAFALRVVLAMPHGLNRRVGLSMLVLGPRHADLRRFRRGHVRWLEQAVLFDLFITKGIRSRANRRRIRLSREKDLAAIPPEVIEELHAIDYGEMVESRLGAVAEALRRAAAGLGDDTPYSAPSLRRAFIHRLIGIYSSEGVTDYRLIATKTGHLKPSTIEAHYCPDLDHVYE